MKTRKFQTVQIRSAETKDGLTRVVASTPDVDRYGDIVEPTWSEKGLEEYRSNPIILWQHDPTIPAIGRAERVEVVDGKLVADIRFDDSEENALGRLVKSQIERGFLNSVSVGFAPGKTTPRAALPKDDPRRSASGFVYSDSYLHEISVVNVPANPAALALRSLGIPSVARHVMEVVETDESVVVTFGKSDEWQGMEALAPTAPETEGYGYDDDDEEDDRSIRLSADETRALVRETVLEVLAASDADLIQQNKTDRRPIERSAPEKSEADPLSSLFGCQ